MKQFLLITVLFLSLYIQAQQLPNPGFENGTNISMADGWNSINSLVVIPNVYPFLRVADAHSGQYGALLTTVSGFGTTIPGVLSLGHVEMGNVSGGIPFSSRPDYLDIYYKHPTTGNAQAHVVFTKYSAGKRDTIAYGGFMADSDVNQYILKKIPIHYFSSAQPDTMNVVFLTDPSVSGDSLFIDDLQFDYLNAIGTINAKVEMKVFPNPSNSTFYFLETLKHDGFIYTATGQLIKKVSAYSTNIDLSVFSDGVYCFKVEGVMTVGRLILKR